MHGMLSFALSAHHQQIRLFPVYGIKFYLIVHLHAYVT